MTKIRSINEWDKIINARIKSLRKMKNMTMTDLGAAIGVTTQQLSKYENCTNRISVGRLILIAKVLEVPVNYFYRSLKDDAKDFNGYRFIEDNELYNLNIHQTALDFQKITNPGLQKSINSLVKSLVAC
jgi:transcriptional regulator with XRE-family HTH domain